jgi:hypothetical protein
MIKAKAKDKEEIKKCVSCQKHDTEVILFDIYLPKYIERNLFCHDCMAVILDSSKKTRALE